MLAKTPKPERSPSVLWTDLLLVAFLVGFDVVARLLPHAPGFMPVAASALFAGRMLRIGGLAPIVPVAAMALSGAAFGPDDWRVMLIVYAAISLPAFAGMASQRWRGAAVPFLVILPCSQFFFATSNFAVWAFSGLYPPRLARLRPVLHRGTAVPAEYGCRRHVLDRRTVRRRLHGAEPTGAVALALANQFLNPLP